MLTLIKTESNGNPWALGINGAHLKFQPNSESQARLWVRYLDAHQYNFDVGLGQINIRQIKQRGYTPEQLLDPCLNLRLASQILTENYQQALKHTSNPQLTLQQALSRYNNGNNHAVYSNGYLARIYANFPSVK
jgi:type IV secretion system protein VirB1